MQLGAFWVASYDPDHALPGSKDSFTLPHFVQQLDLSQSWIRVELITSDGTCQASESLVFLVKVQRSFCQGHPLVRSTTWRQVSRNKRVVKATLIFT